VSAVDPHDVRTSMPAIESHAVADRFARVREAFHRLVEVDLSQRHAALQALSQSDPEIAAELRMLLDRLDETDLLAAPEQAPPSRLGPFRLLHRIGRGGMGEVWLAERVEGGFEQQVALKRVREAALTPDLARRFVRERQILARLQHPNIAHLIDGGVGPDGRPWLAMEYVPGERITHWCHARQLDAVARVRLFLPVCEAVAFAHRNLIVHRDLKPANIQVDAEGRPKLLDFGVARLLDPQDTDQTRTVGAMTPAYAAPEQREGAAITTATDVYQLGVVLRELIDATPRCR
jgi:serine/threonine protein kinase